MADESSAYRILIVEDSILNQHLLRTILEGQYEVQTAGTAKVAREQFENFRPHLILLDIILPDAIGFDVLVELKKNDEFRNIPVIVISGLDSEADEEKGFVLGAVDYIKKPFKDAIVRARVDTQIRIVKQLHTIEQLGLTDALTGVSNRRAFDNQVNYEWHRAIREQREISLLMLDIDKFKVYNDTYGHPQGDAMLRSVAGALRSVIKRSMDIVCRYGGEEFVVLLPGTGRDGALLVAENLRIAVEQVVVLLADQKTPTRATVSIGVSSILPETSDQVDVFIKAADDKLYLAKQNGRNRVEI